MSNENITFPKDFRGIHIHFVGIKGTGCTALVEILVSQGAIITGSDVKERFYTDEILEKYPILGEFLTAAAECENRASTLTGNMVPGLEDVWDNELPNLASGASSPEDFCQVLTDFATANPAQ